MRLIFVDVEARGSSPITGTLTEFGLVDYQTGKEFHGILVEATPDPENPAVPYFTETAKRYDEVQVAKNAVVWLNSLGAGNDVPFILVSDNPTYDGMWINCFFDKTLGDSVFGHSGRRISDFYAGMTGRWKKTQDWKSLRVTAHTHVPTDDARGNAEAVARLAKEFSISDLPEIEWELPELPERKNKSLNKIKKLVRKGN